MPKSLNQMISDLEAKKTEIDKQIEVLRNAASIMAGSASTEKTAGKTKKTGKKARKGKAKRLASPSQEWIVETVGKSKSGLTKAQITEAAQKAKHGTSAIGALLKTAVKEKKLTAARQEGFEGRGLGPFVYKKK